jgi:hypothetical protein
MILQAAEKIIFRRLLKKDQVQGPRNPEECGVLNSTPQRRRTCQWAGETPQMGVFQQPVEAKEMD